eukprot:TRINITY_DN11789_c0_g1_i1.p1 TRINITY_DN11789_c0_g1~~TRINITY_DN11789_c0_g1_i1.p1  ORF type:complete len:1148 (-),score=325.16 TRINITY_DN11789_c0_g1_i1:27-2984(-)
MTALSAELEQERVINHELLEKITVLQQAASELQGQTMTAQQHAAAAEQTMAEFKENYEAQLETARRSDGIVAQLQAELEQERRSVAAKAEALEQATAALQSALEAAQLSTMSTVSMEQFNILQQELNSERLAAIAVKAQYEAQLLTVQRGAETIAKLEAELEQERRAVAVKTAALEEAMSELDAARGSTALTVSIEQFTALQQELSAERLAAVKMQSELTQERGNTTELLAAAAQATARISELETEQAELLRRCSQQTSLEEQLVQAKHDFAGATMRADGAVAECASQKSQIASLLQRTHVLQLDLEERQREVTMKTDALERATTELKVAQQAHQQLVSQMDLQAATTEQSGDALRGVISMLTKEMCAMRESQQQTRTQLDAVLAAITDVDRQATAVRQSDFSSAMELLSQQMRQQVSSLQSDLKQSFEKCISQATTSQLAAVSGVEKHVDGLSCLLETVNKSCETVVRKSTERDGASDKVLKHLAAQDETLSKTVASQLKFVGASVAEHVAQAVKPLMTDVEGMKHSLGQQMESISRLQQRAGQPDPVLADVAKDLLEVKHAVLYRQQPALSPMRPRLADAVATPAPVQPHSSAMDTTVIPSTPLTTQPPAVATLNLDQIEETEEQQFSVATQKRPSKRVHIANDPVASTADEDETQAPPATPPDKKRRGRPARAAPASAASEPAAQIPVQVVDASSKTSTPKTPKSTTSTPRKRKEPTPILISDAPTATVTPMATDDAEAAHDVDTEVPETVEETKPAAKRRARKSDVIKTTPTGEGTKPRKVTVMFSSLEEKDRSRFTTHVTKLKGIVCTQEWPTAECTHLICKPGKRTLKLMAAGVTGMWVVSGKWMEDSIAAGRFVSEDEYGVFCAKEPWSGKTFYLSDAFKSNTQTQHSAKLISLAGGMVVEHVDSADYVLMEDDEHEHAVQGTRCTWNELIAKIPSNSFSKPHEDAEITKTSAPPGAGATPLTTEKKRRPIGSSRPSK